MEEVKLLLTERMGWSVFLSTLGQTPKGQRSTQGIFHNTTIKRFFGITHFRISPFRATTATDFIRYDPLPNSQLPDDQMVLSESETSLSQCSSTSTDTHSCKRWETVVLDEGSDSSDGGTEPGPEK